MDPLEEQENKQERLYQTNMRIINTHTFERQKFKADNEFYRLPWWVQASEEGDRMADGSDEQPYEED